MKFLWAIIIYLLIGAVLGWGIMLAVSGKLWVLAIGVLVYIVAFGKIGCMPPKDSHH